MATDTLESQAALSQELTSDLDPADVAAHYDDLDRFYREMWGEHVHHGVFDRRGMSTEEATRKLISLVADAAGIRPGENRSVCDIGCGYGGTSRVLAGEYGADVTGLTVSSAQYRHALSRTPGQANPRYLLQDWLKNELPSESFDAALSIESSEHMPDLNVFFEQAARVLKPGGRLVICSWLTRDTLRPWEVRHLIEPICTEGRMRGMETVGVYEAAGREVGLELTSHVDLSRKVKSTWPICVGRGIKRLLLDRSYRTFVLGHANTNRVFALTLFRIWLAYETGAMKYGLLTYEKTGR